MNKIIFMFLISFFVFELKPLIIENSSSIIMPKCFRSSPRNPQHVRAVYNIIEKAERKLQEKNKIKKLKERIQEAFLKKEKLKKEAEDQVNRGDVVLKTIYFVAHKAIQSEYYIYDEKSDEYYLPKRKQSLYQQALDEYVNKLLKSKEFDSIKVLVINGGASADTIYEYYQKVENKKDYEDLFIYFIPFYSEEVIQQIKKIYSF